jgi:hypothetical protein
VARIDLMELWADLAAGWGKARAEDAALDRVVALPPTELTRFDEVWRRSFEPPEPPSHLRSALADGARSLDKDGYRRERAVRDLASNPDPRADVFLLLRAYDWVPPVAQVARATLLDRLRTRPFDAARWAPVSVARRRRPGGAEWLAALVSVAGDTAGTWLAHPDGPTRRWAAVNLPASPDRLAEWVDTVRDEIVGGLLTHRWLAAEPGRARALLRHPLALVRYESWNAVDRTTVTADDLRAGLLDRSARVRWVAGYVARRVGFDGEALYATLPDGTEPERRRRLVLLDEWGSDQALPLARALLDAPDVATRTRAIAVFARRADAASLAPRLLTTSGPERRAVSRALLHHGHRVDDRTLEQLCSSDAEGRGIAYRLQHARGPWDALLAALRALASDDEDLRRRGNVGYQDWVRTVGVWIPAPPPELADRVRAAATTAGVDGRFLAFVLRSSG